MSTPRPGFPRMVGRAVLRRCPWCGGKRAWFRSWFRTEDRCRTCGLAWHRNQHGYELGSMMIAVFLTGGAIAAVLVVGIVATYPDIAVVPLLAVGAAVVLVVPVITYPLTYTLWSAVDLALHPPEEAELLDADLHRPGPEVYGADG